MRHGIGVCCTLELEHNDGGYVVIIRDIEAGEPIRYLVERLDGGRLFRPKVPGGVPVPRLALWCAPGNLRILNLDDPVEANTIRLAFEARDATRNAFFTQEAGVSR